MHQQPGTGALVEPGALEIAGQAGKTDQLPRALGIESGLGYHDFLFQLGLRIIELQRDESLPTLATRVVMNRDDDPKS